MDKFTGRLTYDPTCEADQIMRMGTAYENILKRKKSGCDDAVFTTDYKPARNPLTFAELQARSPDDDSLANMRGSYHGETLPPPDAPLVFHVDRAITCALRNGGVIDTDRAFPWCKIPPYPFTGGDLFRHYALYVIFRKIPMKQVCVMLGIPLSTCYRWRKEMFLKMFPPPEAQSTEADAVIAHVKQGLGLD